MRRCDRLPLADLEKFAADEPDRKPRDADAWAALFHRVLDEWCVSADAPGECLTPETLTRLADTFAVYFREHFGVAAPADIEGWDRLLVEVSHVGLRQHDGVALVLGAAIGEYLQPRTRGVVAARPRTARRRCRYRGFAVRAGRQSIPVLASARAG